MNTSRHTNRIPGEPANLIGNIEHRQYIRLQAFYGVAHRGGALFPAFEHRHPKRLISNVNLLSSREHRQLVFSETIFSN